MSYIYLTSIVGNVIDKLIEREQLVPDKLKVAFIQNAADVYEKKWFVEDDIKELEKRGFILEHIDLNKVRNNDLKSRLLENDIIYVSGGNIFYLMQIAIESGFAEMPPKLLKNEYKIYIGGSAGASVLAPTLEPYKLLDDLAKAQMLKDMKGLGLINFCPLPHFGKEKFADAYTKAMKEIYSMPYLFVTLPEDKGIWVEDGKMTIL